MKSWIVPAGSTQFADSLRQSDRDVPQPGPGQVRLRMHAWSTNYRDLAVAGGVYFGGPLARDTIALSDGAGEVSALGEDVTGWAIGDRVMPAFFQKWQAGTFGPHVYGSDMGGPIDGALADEIVVDATAVVKIPESLTYEEAACLPCAAVTAWHSLVDVGSVGSGSTVLLLGTGGVSIFALQFAKALGAKVIVTSSSDDKLAQARSMGADITINYRDNPDWDAKVLEATGGLGSDVVVEVGGPGTLQLSMNAVAPGGTICMVGVLNDPGATVSPLPLIGKSVRLQGIYVGSVAMFEQMCQAIADHGIKPVIDRRFPFDNAPDAYRYQQSGQHFGKVVITRAPAAS